MSLHVSVIHSFLLLSGIPLCECTTFLKKIHSPTDKHLSCFQFLAILNTAARNIQVLLFVWSSIPKINESTNLGVKLLSDMMKLPNCFPKWPYPCTFPVARGVL